MSHPNLTHAPLGHEVAYPTHYDPSLLLPVARELNRRALHVPSTWYGADLWNAYELSWLNAKGKPVVALGRFVFPFNSPNLIESKSLKLYLNSLNETRFADTSEVQERIGTDLSRVAGAPVQVSLVAPQSLEGHTLTPLAGELIDTLDIAIEHYAPAPDVLQCDSPTDIVEETLVSHLLKSNCPVTSQPDWGSVQVQYRGPRISRESLLRYVVSLRRHTEFHEHCVEKMFCDLWQACQPSRLTVYARYTRRGGLDINPWRSSHPATVCEVRNPRQ